MAVTETRHVFSKKCDELRDLPVDADVGVRQAFRVGRVEAQHARHHHQELVGAVQLHADDARLGDVEVAREAGLLDEARETPADDRGQTVDAPHHLLPQRGIVSDPLPVAQRRVLAAGDEPLAVDAPKLEHECGRLDEAVGGAPLLPSGIGAGGDIAIAAAVDHRPSGEAMATGLGLRDHAGDAIALANGIDDLGVEHEPDTGLLRHGHGGALEVVAVEAEGRSALGVEGELGGGALALQASRDFQRQPFYHQAVIAIVEAEPG